MSLSTTLGIIAAIVSIGVGIGTAVYFLVRQDTPTDKRRVLVITSAVLVFILAVAGGLALAQPGILKAGTSGQSSTDSNVSSPTETMSTATPSPTPTDTPSPTAVPTPKPAPKPGVVMFRATNFSSWGASGSWKVVNGNLVSGDTESVYILAPFIPSVSNYVLDMDVQLSTGNQVNVNKNIGFVARIETSQGGVVGYEAQAPCWNSGYPSIQDLSTGNSSNSTGYQMSCDSSWHHIRLIVKDTSFTLYADGQIVTTFTDAQDLDPGQVGIYANGSGVAIIKDFSVTAD